MERIVDFFKKCNLYDEEYFNKIKKNTKVYLKKYEEIKDFVGCYPIYENKKIIDFKLILPTINSIYDELIYIHEYTHALFLDDDLEIFPNILEAHYINLYVKDIKLKKELLKKFKYELNNTEDMNHRIGITSKLINIKR